jgi:hypothetical protein
MGYHVSITRERNGSESDIPLDDWLAHVRASPELEFETATGTDKASEFTRSIHAARWSGAEDAWLGWSHGEIWTKNPSEELIRYMIDIAPKFAARVRGDEGEFYRTIEDVYYEEEGEEVSKAREEQRRAEVARHKKKQFYMYGVRLIILLIIAYLFLRKHF